MKTIKVGDQTTVIGVHVLTKVVDGNHVPHRVRKTYTLVTAGGKQLEITDHEYEAFVVGSGIRKYSGTLETGGGRHAFYGTDLAAALDLIVAEYKEEAQAALGVV